MSDGHWDIAAEYTHGSTTDELPISAEPAIRRDAGHQTLTFEVS